MQIQCVVHWEEMYIRSYPLRDDSVYARKLVDLPVTVQCQDSSQSKQWFMTYRRELNETWRVFCNEVTLRSMRNFLEQNRAKAVDQQLAKLFEQIQTQCKQAMQDVPESITRRDLLKRQIETGQAQLLLQSAALQDGTVLAFFHVGGSSLVAVEHRFEDEVLELREVQELSLAQWKALCHMLKSQKQVETKATPVAMNQLIARFYQQEKGQSDPQWDPAKDANNDALLEAASARQAAC
ncbi:MAG: hypothetical protein R3194_05975 [Limnobacter sp.]|nr:hypothetical protein [Limnobacter sp.]